MRFFWGPVMLTLILSIAATLMTTRGVNPKGTSIEWIAQNFVTILICGTGLLLLTLKAWYTSRLFSSQELLPQLPTEQERSRLIELVQMELLERDHTRQLNSLTPDAIGEVVLEVKERADVTQDSLHRNSSDSSTTSIIQAYEKAAQGLLILGAPGSGKSTLLLKLALELLTRAKHTTNSPIPIMVNLSSWSADNNRELAPWLIEQLWTTYNIPSRLSHACIEKNQFLLLLDGLDEIMPSTHAMCIEAINAYRKEHFERIIICSRSGEYQKQPEHLQVRLMTVEVQPLKQELVEKFLKERGEPLEELYKIWRNNSTWHELLTTPFMLSAAIQTFHNRGKIYLPQPSTLKELQDHIFDNYIKRKLEVERERGYWHYSSHQTLTWLIWLAQQMSHHGITEFYPERLQATWLPTERLSLYRLFSRLLSLMTGRSSSKAKEEIRPSERMVWQWDGFWRGRLFDALFGLFIGWLVFVFSKPLFAFISIAFFIFLRITGLTFTLSILPLESVSKLTSNFMHFGQLLNGWLSNLSLILVVGLLGSLAIGLLGRVERAFSAETNEPTYSKPNQGIQNSGRNALRFGCLFGLPSGLVIGGLVFWLLSGSGLVWFFGLAFQLYPGLAFGLYSGLVFGLIEGLSFGGQAYLQHYFLRFLLWRYGVMPRHYVRFLNEATERRLLERVGGGYRFIHLSFQEYFASL